MSGAHHTRPPRELLQPFGDRVTPFDARSLETVAAGLAVPPLTPPDATQTRGRDRFNLGPTPQLDPRIGQAPPQPQRSEDDLGIRDLEAHARGGRTRPASVGLPALRALPIDPERVGGDAETRA